MEHKTILIDGFPATDIINDNEQESHSTSTTATTASTTEAIERMKLEIQIAMGSSYNKSFFNGPNKPELKALTFHNSHFTLRYIPKSKTGIYNRYSSCDGCIQTERYSYTESGILTFKSDLKKYGIVAYPSKP